MKKRKYILKMLFLKLKYCNNGYFTKHITSESTATTSTTHSTKTAAPSITTTTGPTTTPTAGQSTKMTKPVTITTGSTTSATNTVTTKPSTGGQYCDTSKPVIKDCTIYVRQGNPTIYISQNTVMVRVGIKCMTTYSQCLYLYGGYSLHIISTDITGNKKGRFIYMQSGSSLELHDVKGHGFGVTSSNGGFIYHNGNYKVTISDSTIKHNQGSNGGAIYLNGIGKFTAYNTTFEANTAKYSGGAIYGSGNGDRTKTTMNIWKSTFNTNKAKTNHGGAIYAQYNTATVKETMFTANTAKSHGGGLYLPSSTFRFHCSLIAFNAEHGNKYGGGISASSTQITLTNTMFLQNKDNTGKTNDIYCHNTADTVIRDLYTTALQATGSCSYGYIPPSSKQNTECSQPQLSH